MAGGFLAVASVLDEVIAVAGAIGAYAQDGDESKLAGEIVKQVFSAANGFTNGMASQVIPEERVRAFVENGVELLEDILNI
jgi:hypothetical protein